jgi:hypothetical protein
VMILEVCLSVQFYGFMVSNCAGTIIYIYIYIYIYVCVCVCVCVLCDGFFQCVRVRMLDITHTHTHTMHRVSARPERNLVPRPQYVNKMQSRTYTYMHIYIHSSSKIGTKSGVWSLSSARSLT